MADDWDVDALLLERCLAGDVRAREELFARHAPVVIRFFRNTVRTEELEDLAQETLARLFEALPRVRDGRLLRAFIRKIARNVLLEHVRHLSHDHSFDPSRDAIADLERETKTLAVGRNEMRLLLMGLRRLPLDHQILLEQHYFEGRSMVELAEELDLAASTVRNRKKRAHELLIAEIAALEASGPLIASTIEHLDDWAREIRERLHDEQPVALEHER